MDFIVSDILSGELIPVLLGLSAQTTETAHRMYRQYGVVSHVFCERISLPRRLSLCMKFHTVHRTPDERLMIEALIDFAKQLGHADVILYLIPCAEEYVNALWLYRNELERYYVIADRAEMERVWFGKSLQTPMKGETT